MSMPVIEHIEVTDPAGQASITFSSIPADYTDLMILVSFRSTNAALGNNIAISINGSQANLSRRTLFGNGSSVASASTNGQRIGLTNGAGATSNTFSNNAIYIPNYASSNAKSISTDSVIENNATGGWQELIATLWNNTDAITSIELEDEDGGTLVQYSSATIYGILAGSDGTTAVS